MSKWILTEQHKPTKDGQYLVTIDEKVYYIPYAAGHWNAFFGLDGNLINDGEFADEQITAWQPIPEPYKEGE